ncbi:helix-turn-helix transcriptional regulator [Streptomyces sp. LX-29]|uniref:helix-turn-helix domain-containing protein n=1 Tax=Streptomyces sp. LX-29 TaxID=2900152 RepID=UPI00240E28EC|nr:helix-turn-helix transcriptional regulator [Streptomyces sp. LX-29]WFB09229.1 helix-turn-helix transcriptional regulator [Streptomyces sp. LX-29]
MPAPKELDPSKSLEALFGLKLRKLRMRTGWTQRELGAKVCTAHSRIAQFELGKETPPEEVCVALDAVLGADGDLIELWTHVKRTPFPDWAQRFIELEARACAMHKYTAHTVPGLLQTETYAREVLRVGLPWLAPDAIEEKTQARLARQSLLSGPEPPLLWAVLDEAVIRRPVAGAAAMREQLAYVIECAQAPNVEIQVLPYSAGAHSAMDGTLTLLSFESMPDVAYLEGGHHGELVEDRAAVARHSHRYDLVQAMALPPAASTALIREAMEGFSACAPEGST